MSSLLLLLLLLFRLKKEYSDEMNEREEDNSAKIKHLLKEFQVKLAEKEKEYQDQFVSSIGRHSLC